MNATVYLDNMCRRQAGSWMRLTYSVHRQPRYLVTSQPLGRDTGESVPAHRESDPSRKSVHVSRSAPVARVPFPARWDHPCFAVVNVTMGHAPPPCSGKQGKQTDSHGFDLGPPGHGSVVRRKRTFLVLLATVRSGRNIGGPRMMSRSPWQRCALRTRRESPPSLRYSVMAIPSVAE